MVAERTNLECSNLKVGQDLRIRLPQALLQQVAWITGDKAVDGWLLVGSPGRCRLLSATEVRNDPGLQLLQGRIAEELDAPSTNALEFRDEVSVVLALRLLPVQITHVETGWRLALPRPIIALMQISPGESEIAALFYQGHVEFWTLETLRSAAKVPLTELL